MSDILVEMTEAVPVEVNLPAKDNAIEMDVYYQDEISLDTDLALLYIKSGEKEIENYVEGVAKPEIDGYIQEYAKPIVSEVVDQIATSVIDEYFEGTVKPELSRFAAEEMAGYAETATTQASIAIAAATEASATAQSVDVKVAEFSEQTEASKQEFISFADEKTSEFEQTAITATEQAVGSAERSRIWAEGEQSEVKPLGGELSSMGAADLAYAIANAPEDTPIDASGLFAMNVVKGEKGDKGDKGDDGKDGGGLEIGDVAFAVMGIDETKNLRRYLNGQVISQSQFVSFANWVKERAKLYPNTVATEENWQAEVTNSKLGQCGKFVIGESTIRLPKVVNINGLQDLALMGSVKAESLPNITGTAGIGAKNASGCFQISNVQWNIAGGENKIIYNGSFDASRSSSTYQDNAPVQQEAIQYPYFIQVATGVEESVDVTREIELNNPFSLLDYKWSEYELSNASWLLSNGAFHSADVYYSVYVLLWNIKNGDKVKSGVSVKTVEEDYGDYDFVVDGVNRTFRLPIKVKLASGNAVVGNGMALGLTNGTDNFGLVTGASVNTNAFYLGNSANAYGGKIGGKGATKSPSIDIWSGITTDPTKSGIETSSSGLKLYFYVGETIQDANVIVASNALTEIANLKNYDYVVESYNDGTNWYRIYKSGWIEQGGTVSPVATNNTVTFLKPFKERPYVSITRYSTYSGSISTAVYWINGFTAREKTYFKFSADPNNSSTILWQACGQGE